MIDSQINKLERLSRKIESNTATLDNYREYEYILLNSGLDKSYIYEFLQRAGFNSWEELVEAREDKEQEKNIGTGIIGGIVGLGLGLVLAALFSDD